MIMRSGRLERFILLPFSIRCDSDSSVALATVSTAASATTDATASAAAAFSPKQSKTRGIKGGDEDSRMDIKNQTVSKPSFSEGLHRLIRRIKSFSQFFVYKEEIEATEDTEMEIGFPTDVKHVTHIGLDGSTTVNSNPNRENSLKATEILSFPSLSLQQFELAMAAQSRAPIAI